MSTYDFEPDPDDFGPEPAHIANYVGARRAYGQACREDLIALVQAVHKAKGRYHSQIAMCNLYDACNLPNTRPTK